MVLGAFGRATSRIRATVQTKDIGAMYAIWLIFSECSYSSCGNDMSGYLVANSRHGPRELQLSLRIVELYEGWT